MKRYNITPQGQLFEDENGPLVVYDEVIRELQAEVERLRKVISDIIAKIRPPLAAIKQDGLYECSCLRIEATLNQAENNLDIPAPDKV